jgi:hypothetical protein
MFNNLSQKNKKKLLLNTFLYYPLALVIAISIAIAILKYIGMMIDAPIGFIVMLIIIGIIIAIYHISQIYKNLLKEDKDG